jgi:hypothetical protein
MSAKVQGLLSLSDGCTQLRGVAHSPLAQSIEFYTRLKITHTQGMSDHEHDQSDL